MKKLLLALFLCCVPVCAQVVNPGAIRNVSVEPSGSCSTTEVRQYGGQLYGCQSGTWAATGSATPDASTTTKGKAELATIGEVVTGTDAGRIVTPAGVAAMKGKIRAIAYASLPTTTYSDGATVEDGDIVRVSDRNRDLYRWNASASKWVSQNGERFNAFDNGQAYETKPHGNSSCLPRISAYLFPTCSPKSTELSLASQKYMV
jgi:hypothetical protein